MLDIKAIREDPDPFRKGLARRNLADAVDALLAAINGLSSKSSTNWEDALFRTFFEADGSTTSQMPETVVFFTDGVPTTERLTNRTAPGVLPPDPGAIPPGMSIGRQKY